MIEPPLMPDTRVIGTVAGVLLVAIVALLVVRRVTGGPTDAQRERDRAHEAAQKRAPEEAAQKGETYELVVKETQYDRDPPEVRGTINGLQTFVREIPDPAGSDALTDGETIRVQITDYGTEGTTAQARFLGRA
jgi:cell division septation protein DedD